MKKNNRPTNGPQKNGHAVSDLMAALSTSHYQQLTGFARWRLRAVTYSRWLQQCLLVVDAGNLVHEALLKMLLGEDNPTLGCHLMKPRCVNIEAFVGAVSLGNCALDGSARSSERNRLCDSGSGR